MILPSSLYARPPWHAGGTAATTVGSMTEQTWQEEVESAIANTHWMFFVTRFDPETTACTAHMVHRRTRQSRHVTLSFDTFNTPELRREEIRRQLGVDTDAAGSQW